MTVKVGSCWSTPLQVTGGCPQGSVLGVFLFNTATDDLEDEFLDQEHDRLGLQRPQPPSTKIESSAATSTPSNRASLRLEESPIVHSQHSFIISPRARNIPIQYSSEGYTTPPAENKVGTQVLSQKPIKIRKYVDDNLICEKMNLGDVQVVQGEVAFKEKQAFPSQNAFRGVTGNAKKKGMKVNTSKTKILCISDAMNYTPRTFIFDSDGVKICNGHEMKLLGFYFGPKPTVDYQVRAIIKRLRQRYWSLRHLRKVGFNETELVKVYKTSILPVADYCDVIYHSMLTDEHDQLLERAQVMALKCIFDPKLSGRKLRELAGLETLRERRIKHCDAFAAKCAASRRFSKLFPLREGRISARNTERYKEFYARCDRLKNSPLFFMRRRLNGKPGKTYGERNREYRED